MVCPCRIVLSTLTCLGLAPGITAGAVELVFKKAVWALGGSAVGSTKTGTIRLRWDKAIKPTEADKVRLAALAVELGDNSGAV